MDGKPTIGLFLGPTTNVIVENDKLGTFKAVRVKNLPESKQILR